MTVVSVLLSSCATTGVKVDPNTVSTFEIGKTTYSEVIQQLGTPSTNTLSGNGERMIVYTYAEAQVRPESFIPIVGLFVQGVDSKATSVALQFDKKGVLKDKAVTEAQNGIGTGLVTGSPRDAKSPGTR